jgi:hypothetical protein
LSALPEGAVIERKTPSDMASCIGANEQLRSGYAALAQGGPMKAIGGGVGAGMPEGEATSASIRAIRPRPSPMGPKIIYHPPHNIYAQHVILIHAMAELRVAQRRRVRCRR